MFLQLGETRNVVVSSAESAREVMKTHDLNFANRPVILAGTVMAFDSTDVAFAPYGAYWRQLKKICTVELLSSKRVQSFRHVREEEVSRFVDRILLSTILLSTSAGVVDLSKETRRYMSTVIARSAFGEKCGGDLVDILLKVQEKGELEIPFTDDNVKAIILDVFTGGSDTTSSLIEWTMSEMLRNPRVLYKAQEEVRQHSHLFSESKNIVEEANISELNYLKLVIKEALVPRQNMENCEIDGYTIPANTKIIINAWAIGRNPKYWTQPDMFYPERFIDSNIDYRGFNFEFIPFGAGRRMCPGITFGITNVELVLANLLYHFDWVLPNGEKFEDLDMTETLGIMVNRKTNLCLVPIPYRPAA
ncbi:Cytochrome P450 726A27 [Linum perenne]